MAQFYTIGLDYGSLSCRGVLARTSDGAVAAEAEFPYPHGVLDSRLPGGAVLPPLWALQDPRDYVEALHQVVPALLARSGLPGEAVIGLGIDTTASTVVAVDRDLTPLCQRRGFENRPHAWPKLWKHHAAHAEARELTAAAAGEPALERCGGAVGAEFLPPKLLQTLREDPAVFAAAETFFECGDWLASLLTGREVRSGAYLTCKSLWDPARGYPAAAPFDRLAEKLAFRGGARPAVAWPGQSVGTLTPEMARRLGLSPRTVVSAPQMDGYAGMPGSGAAEPGTLAMMLGTSNAYMLLGREPRRVPGICAAVPDSILPGFTGYAAGQSGTGDMLRWFTENCVPAAYERAAQAEGVGLHAYLAGLAAGRGPGESGLLALDWWNGSKSVLNNPRLSGLLLGMTLATKPEDLYRALIEATACGARRIAEALRQGGVAIHSAVASGGMAAKNPLLVQIYADVLGMPITVSPCGQTAALGSAMYAAAAAGSAAGGFDTAAAAVAAMSHRGGRRYEPDRAASSAYDRLYREYLDLHDYFGRGGSRVMERLHPSGGSPDENSWQEDK